MDFIEVSSKGHISNPKSDNSVIKTVDSKGYSLSNDDFTIRYDGLASSYIPNVKFYDPINVHEAIIKVARRVRATQMKGGKVSEKRKTCLIS